MMILLYQFGVIDVYISINILDQTIQSLTLTKNYTLARLHLRGRLLGVLLSTGMSII